MTLLRREPNVFTEADYPILADRVAIPCAVGPHIHDFIELALVVAGRAVHRTADGDRMIIPGQVVAVRPGSWHAYLRPERCTVINVYVGPRLLLTDLAWCLAHPSLVRLLLHGGASTDALAPDRLAEVTGWLDQLARPRRDRPEPGPEEAIVRRSLLGCALGRLAGLTIASAGTSMITQPVQLALTAMTGDLARPWTVAELARAAAVSPSRLHRLFRTEVGSTPLGWLTRSRAERFAVLLLGSDDPIAAIGRAVGWPDPNYASRRFRQVYGISPSDYRHRLAFDRIGS
ncbi:helix-turn-helix transcriptional regulator [Microlunatus parietis]|uniref:AraC family L-rhamnose operon transcriptional activator RhaR n=1 Tax=Microlunatus parietis TaxID=682979 RepID=A0A7Y9I787_9ACTN|nr:AraC family transcriptional regulator [Microlunatus parietis]NYE71271.1 AraC family L-rhamnose operon transcriptional activator RhaR [Microlunatus parietis]